MIAGTDYDRWVRMARIILGIAACIGIIAAIIIVPCLMIASDTDDKMGYG